MLEPDTGKTAAHKSIRKPLQLSIDLQLIARRSHCNVLSSQHDLSRQQDSPPMAQAPPMHVNALSLTQVLKSSLLMAAALCSKSSADSFFCTSCMITEQLQHCR